MSDYEKYIAECLNEMVRKRQDIVSPVLFTKYGYRLSQKKFLRLHSLFCTSILCIGSGLNPKHVLVAQVKCCSVKFFIKKLLPQEFPLEGSLGFPSLFVQYKIGSINAKAGFLEGAENIEKFLQHLREE